tara:strand:- start:343 stop:450 length:108 start_codon:yes stop_codon:yes gene_type:complete
MFDFIYQCFGIKRKREKVKWYLGEEALLIDKKSKE